MQAQLQGLVRLSPSRQIQHTLLSSPGRGGAPAAAAAAATAAAICQTVMQAGNTVADLVKEWLPDLGALG
jgi:hypothetical protein